jgi:hypothetical protein
MVNQCRVMDNMVKENTSTWDTNIGMTDIRQELIDNTVKDGGLGEKYFVQRGKWLTLRNGWRHQLEPFTFGMLS